MQMNVHPFTCLGCGRPLSQETVVFDLLDPPEKCGTDGLTLYLTQKELLHLAKWDKKSGRYILRMDWKKCLRYMGNKNNKNCPELSELKYEDADAYVNNTYKGDGHIFDQLQNGMGMKQKDLRRELKRLMSIVERGTGNYRRDLVIHKSGQMVTEVTLSDPEHRAEKAVSRRRCRVCGTPVFEEAGTTRHTSVVLVGTEEDAAAPGMVLDALEDFLRGYNGTDLGSWSARSVCRKDGPVRSTTFLIEDRKKKKQLLTLAVAEKRCYTGGEDIRFFPDADAFVLCVCLQADGDAPGLKDRRKARQMLDCLIRLQEDWERRMKERSRLSGYGPVLMMYQTQNVPKPDREPSSPLGIDPIFPNDRAAAKQSSECRKLRSELENQLRDCFYTQLFCPPGKDNPEIGQAARWILHITGCLEVDLHKVQTPQKYYCEPRPYRLAAPVWRGLRPDVQQRLRSDPGSKNLPMDSWKAELVARIHLFDNPEPYINPLGSSSVTQMKMSFESMRKKGAHGPAELLSSPTKKPSYVPSTTVPGNKVPVQEKPVSPPPEPVEPEEGVKITFLIGNGFDEGLGLRSSYTDFCRVYTDKTSAYYPKDDPGFVKAIRTDGCWSDYEEWFGDHTRKHNRDSREEKERLLDRNDKFRDLFTDYLNDRESKMIFAMEDGPEKDVQLRSAREMMYQALRNFFSSANIGQHGYEAIRKVLMGSSMADRKYNFRFVCFNYSRMLENCIATFPGKLVGKIIDFDRDGFLGHTARITRVHYPHGSLARQGDTVLVMGVNDSSQIGARFTWRSYPNRLIKHKIVSHGEHPEQYTESMRLIQESDIVVVYGMSIGATDKLWWKEVLYEWLREKPTRQLIFYSHDGSEKAVRERFRRMIWPDEKLKTCMMSSGDCSRKGPCRYRDNCKEWQGCLQRIHFSIGHDIFAKDLRIDPEADN